MHNTATEPLDCIIHYADGYIFHRANRNHSSIFRTKLLSLERDVDGSSFAHRLYLSRILSHGLCFLRSCISLLPFRRVGYIYIKHQSPRIICVLIITRLRGDAHACTYSRLHYGDDMEHCLQNERGEPTQREPSRAISLLLPLPLMRYSISRTLFPVSSLSRLYHVRPLYEPSSIPLACSCSRTCRARAELYICICDDTRTTKLLIALPRRANAKDFRLHA